MDKLEKKVADNLFNYIEISVHIFTELYSKYPQVLKELLKDKDLGKLVGWMKNFEDVIEINKLQDFINGKEEEREDL